MGYYTVFSGDVTGPEVLLMEFFKDAERGDTFGEYAFPLNYLLDDHVNYGESMKWYSHEKDMDALSLLYPNLLFTLSGEGEESGDMWRQYHRNGKNVYVKAKVVFDEPENLEELLPLIPGVEDEAKEKIISQRRAELESKVSNYSTLLSAAQKELDDLG